MSVGPKWCLGHAVCKATWDPLGHSISIHLLSTLNPVQSFISQSMCLIEVVGSDPLNFRPQCHASHVGKTLLNRGNLDLWHAKFRVILGSSGKLV